MAKKFKLEVKRLGGMHGADKVVVTHGESIAHLQPLSILAGELCATEGEESCSWCQGLAYRLEHKDKVAEEREIRLALRRPDADDKTIVGTLMKHGDWTAIDGMVIARVMHGELCPVGVCKWCDTVQNAIADYVVGKEEREKAALAKTVEDAQDEILANTIPQVDVDVTSTKIEGEVKSLGTVGELMEKHGHGHVADIDAGVDPNAETKVMPETTPECVGLIESHLEVRTMLHALIGYIGIPHDAEIEEHGKTIPVVRCGVCDRHTTNIDDALEDESWHTSTCLLMRTKRALEVAEKAAVRLSKTMADKVVKVLGLMYAADPVAIARLFTHRVPCNDKMADMENVMVAEGPTVGLLGVLNALLLEFGPFGIGRVTTKSDDKVTAGFAVVNIDGLRKPEED